MYCSMCAFVYAFQLLLAFTSRYICLLVARQMMARVRPAMIGCIGPVASRDHNLVDIPLVEGGYLTWRMSSHLNNSAFISSTQLLHVYKKEL